MVQSIHFNTRHQTLIEESTSIMDSARWLLVYFQLCGICHLSNYVNPPTKWEQFYFKLWTIFHLLVLTTIVAFTIYYADGIFILDDLIESTIDFSQWLLPITSQYISIVESLYTNQTRRQFLLRLRYIDHHLLNMSAQQTNRTIAKFTKKFLAILLVAITTQIYVMISVASDPHWLNHLSFSLFTFIVCCSEVLFCVFFIDMVKDRTDILVDRMTEISNVSNKRRVLVQLRYYKKSYELLWQAMVDINQAFGE